MYNLRSLNETITKRKEKAIVRRKALFCFFFFVQMKEDVMFRCSYVHTYACQCVVGISLQAIVLMSVPVYRSFKNKPLNAVLLNSALFYLYSPFPFFFCADFNAYEHLVYRLVFFSFLFLPLFLFFLSFSLPVLHNIK